MHKSKPEPVPAAAAAQPLAAPRRPKRRMMLNLVFSVFTRLQGALFTYLTTYLLLRALAVEEYGLYTVLFIGTMGSLTLLGRLGLLNLLQRFVPEYFTQGRYRLIARLFRATNLLQSAVGGVLLIFTFALAPQISGWMDLPQAANLLRVFAVGAISFLLAENYRALLGSLFLHDAIFWRNLIYNVVRLGVILYVVRLPNPLLAVVIAESALYLASLVLFVLAYRHAVKPRIAADPHPDERPPWGRFRRYTALSYANEVGVMLLNSATDLFLVTGFIGGAAAGLYGLANRIMALVHYALPANFLSAVITPFFFSEYGSSRENARFGFNLLIKIDLLVTIPIGVWLAVMAHPLIVEVFDPRYAEAAGILVIMGLFLPMETLRYPLGLMLQNAERNDLLIYSKIFGVLKIAVGLLLLGQGHGVLVMALITGFAIFGQNLLSYFWIVRVLGTHADYAGMLRLVLNGALSALVLVALRPLFPELWGLLLSLVVYGGLYIGLNLLHRSFRAEEREYVNSKLPWPVWRF